MIQLWLYLLCILVGTAALFVAATRLAEARPQMWGPLVLVSITISTLVMVGVIAGVLIDRFASKVAYFIDLHRYTYYQAQEKAKDLESELHKADHDISLLVQDKQQLEQTIAEQAKRINSMEPQIKELHGLRAQIGKRATDKDLSSTP